MTTIEDMISGLVIGVKNHERALAIAKERVEHHNSTFAYSHRGIHMPQNAYIDDRGETIYIRRRNDK